MLKHKTVLTFALALLLAGCAGVRPPSPDSRPTENVSVTFLDVGQADATLIRTPEGETVLIDTGQNGRTAALLRKLGIRRIDLLILTHAHADHTGGVESILESFPVNEIWYSGLDYKAKLRRLLERNGGLQKVSAGFEKRFAKLILTVLHPQAKPLRNSVNNRSVVVKAVYGSASYLFPGDCELECWDQLFKFHRAELRADVLKAAHHGSGNGTSSGVLINVRPATIVVSCGRGNDYGHPHSIVLRLVDRLGAQLLRTDLQGTIECAGARCAPVAEAALSEISGR
ncbi:MAG TPA: MBL fold metallo-hydrolase [Bryobacteraceae bacterium]|nr:MBL fold metallo-hydrolase [Bryobacteraceae bacterium]HOL71959.1 MBL fold metallo-hydrolase [Bryobacteraceae bacterium]HOQ45608.1 MBL fold metallo-hydrolase [Bryobacteraceae bacterium]HPQ15357.1 MBL fold metallo-hydrolase [Bryobacteraceae bacterium]HPU72759.1 MBL fold metallo-hydrolase [Bryobacteraceae bacterium]